MDNIELARVNHFVLAKQHLTPGTTTDDLVRIAGDVGGLHATAVTTPYLSLLARTRTFARDDLDGELHEQRTLAKLRCVRNTIHIHPLQAIPFVFRATVDMVTRGSERYMLARGVSPAQFRALSEAIIAMLKGREMPASAIKEALQSDLDVSAVLGLLCDQGMLVRTRPERSWRDRRQSYALLAEHLPGLDLYALDEREATRLLVQHYLAAFGPATEADIVWWTGLGKRRVRAALANLADRTTQVRIAELDGRLVALRSEVAQMHDTAVPTRPVVNLLPVLDPYIMGYKDRVRYLDEHDQAYVFDRSGNVTSTVVVSGRVAGVWDLGEDREPTVKLLLFRPVDPEVREAIEARARQLGAFVHDREASVRWCASMVPLTERTAGGMMSPLRDFPADDAT